MSTDRYTSRSGETPPQSPKPPTNAPFKGKEDYRLLANPLPTPQAEALNKLSQGQLLGLLEWLGPRDLEILDSLRSAKYLLTGQIQRLHVPVVKSLSGAIRNTSNTMRKLKSYGLVKTFQRRIGGARAGSSSLIWCLTEAGQRFLNARDGLETTRRSHRYLEPSYVHIRHTLAIAECYVQLVEISRGSKKLQLKSVEWEPDCWRPYTYDHHRFQLKPDLFVGAISRIIVPEHHCLIYELADGSTADAHWEHPSRKLSWTDEMREAARQKALKQHKEGGQS